MKYLKAILGVALLATLLSVPTGCGGSGKIEKKEGGEVVPPAAGHQAAVQNMGKKPSDAK
jgi:hypothetical protein